MSFAVVGIVLAAALSVIAAAHLLPVLVAYSVGQTDQAVVFAMTGLLTAFVAGALGLATRDQVKRPMVTQRLAALGVAWLIAPAFAAIAFVGVDPDVLYADAYFDAVSALTTTGSVSLINEISQSPAVMIWRATLQWVGGFATLLMAMVVLAQLGLAGLSLRRTPMPPGNTSGPFGRYWPAMLALGATYGSVTLVGLIGLLLTGMPLIPAMGLAFSAVSTSGVMPQGGVLVTGVTYWPAIIVAFMLFAGATNYMRHSGMARRSVSAYWEDPEFRYITLAVIVGGIVLALLLTVWAGADLSLARGMLWVLSLLSTSVHPVDQSGFATIPLLVALSLVFVGGSTMSTAGGIKLMRLALMMKQGAREISRLAHPHGIVHTDFGGRPYTMALMRGVWTMFIIMLALALLASLALTAGGVPFVQAITAAIGALANAGPVLGFAAGADGSVIGLDTAQVYAAMPAASKLVLSVAMIAGRVEVLAFVGILVGLSTRDS
ncbi:potassium transporter TrkG [Pyruvatibacter sp.]|uniref:potassium transporter TrkG n=1 Tax=Pyruvatibacter sp. TaxID=1981328 RepID=UPI0032EEC01A